MQAVPPRDRGMRRWHDRAAPRPRAAEPAAHRRTRADPRRPATVGELASRLGLTLPTVSGVLADLDRAGLVERRPDPADRRRTIVQIIPGQAP